MMKLIRRVENLIDKHLKIDAKYYVKGSFWNLFGQGSATIAGLLLSITLVNTLSEHEYGTYKYLLGIAALLASFSFTGLDQSVLQATSKGLNNFYNETFNINKFFAWGTSFLGICFASYYFINGNYILAYGCLIIAIFQPLMIVYQNIFSFLNGLQKFKISAILQSTRSLLASIITFFVLFITTNVLIIISVFLSSQVIINFIVHKHFNKISTLIITPSEKFKLYINYAKHNTFRNLLTGVSGRLDSIIIFTQLGSSELAIYSVANIIPEQVKAAIKNFSVLLVPKFSKHSDISDIRKILPLRSIQLFILLCFISIAYITTAETIMKSIFPNYLHAISLSQIASLSFPAAIAILPLGALQSQIKEKSLYKISLYGSIVTILLTVVLTIKLSVLGTVLAKLFSRYINMVLSYYFVYVE